MKPSFLLMLAVAALSTAFPASGVSATPAATPAPTAAEVKAITMKVADWQIATFEDMGKYRALPEAKQKDERNRAKYHDLEWHCAALYAGMAEWSTIAGDSRYTDWLKMIGERNGWKLHTRKYHADDQAVGQFYLSLYQQFKDPAMLAPTQERFDWILANRKTGSLQWGKGTDASSRWGWCDSLFMAPPVWARLAKITGEEKYLDFLDQEYHATYDLLWDQEEHLFWRDTSFLAKREANGRKVFWARGNGWVFGGLALMIPDLPKDWKGRAFYIELFQQMAVSLKAIQRVDGTWSMGLLGGIEGYPLKEVSGTAFYTLGLAWGVNNGLLDRATYEPVILKAWQALTTCVREDGLLGYVQPVGAAPGDSFADSSEVYGVGAFLAAGTEVYKLVGDSVSPVTEKHLIKPAALTTFMKDGGWCWYQDPRAIIHQEKLILGGIDGQNGDVKISVYDLKMGRDLGTVVLHGKFERDDHDAPALYARPDGCILAVYAKHAQEKIHYYRISDPSDYLRWGPEQQFVHDYSGKTGVTYMNLFYLEKEKSLYNFFRDGPSFNPSFITSSDHGATWGNRTHLIADGLGSRNRPYARYLQVNPDTVGISFTEAHPRNFGNSLYYAEFRGGVFYRADGSKIKNLSAGPLLPADVEKVYTGSGFKKRPVGFESVPNSAWTCATVRDAQGRPQLGYSVYLSNNDHRFRIASWSGSAWIDREIAYAGKCLYPEESSYTGLLAFDPSDPTTVYISSDVDPATGKDAGGTHEIYTAKIGPSDDIASIHWQPLTAGSAHRNIRPLVVTGDGHKVLLWLSGPWNTFTDYQSDAVGLILQ